MKLQTGKTFRIRIWICVKILIIVLLFINLCEIFIMFKDTEKPSEFNRCYLDAVAMESNPENWSQIEDDGPIPLEDVLLAKETPQPGKSIFFLETSCPCSNSLFDVLTLNSRQACAVESAALHNPNMQVFVLFACPTSRHQFDPVVDAMLSYTNVKLRHVNLWRYSVETPIEDWVKKDELFRSRYLMNNISDLLHLLSLYRFGGIYLDMDVVVLRSLEEQPLNFVGAELYKYISNAVIGLKPKGFGHKMAELFLRDFQENYKGDIWGHNGPRSVLRVMTNMCNTSDISLMQEDLNRCHGMKVFHINAFFEIQPAYWTYFFEPKFANETLERLKNSYVTHLWNRISVNRSLRVDSKAAYIQLAAQHCPKVLAATKKYFN